jgi:hypothetical protein
MDDEQKINIIQMSRAFLYKKIVNCHYLENLHSRIGVMLPQEEQQYQANNRKLHLEIQSIFNNIQFMVWKVKKSEVSGDVLDQIHSFHSHLCELATLHEP